MRAEHVSFVVEKAKAYTSLFSGYLSRRSPVGTENRSLLMMIVVLVSRGPLVISALNIIHVLSLVQPVAVKHRSPGPGSTPVKPNLLRSFLRMNA